MNVECTMMMQQQQAAALNDKRMLDREALRSVIQQWNANRLDLFELSEPDEVTISLSTDSGNRYLLTELIPFPEPPIPRGDALLLPRHRAEGGHQVHSRGL